jgi:NAD-dependent dihydropyrimidine dehydrogenase PreA subunit
VPVKINYKRCSGCKRCYDVCPIDIFAWDDEKDMPVVAYQYECSHCGICWMECPKRAIEIALPASFY